MFILFLACATNDDLLGRCDATATAIADTEEVAGVSLDAAEALLAEPLSYDVLWSPELIGSLPTDVPEADVLELALSVVSGTATRRAYPGGGCKPRKDSLGFTADVTLNSAGDVVSATSRVRFELSGSDLADVEQLEAAAAELLPSVVDATMEARGRPGEDFEGATVWVQHGLSAPEFAITVDASWGKAAAMSGAGTRRELD